MATTAIIGDGSVAVYMEAETPAASRSHTKDKPPKGFYQGRYVSWGRGNNLPELWLKKLSNSTIAARAIERKVEIMYGTGVRMYKCVHDEMTGEERKVFVADKNIQAFFDKIKIHQFLLGRLFDFYRFANCFSETILNRGKNKVTSLRIRHARRCRLMEIDEDTGEIEFLGYSTNWSGYSIPGDVVDIPLKNVYDEEEEYIENLDGYKFAQWSCLPLGNVYYQSATHAGVMRDDGWLDVANSIPEIINAMHRNQVSLKYIIKIPITAWRFWYSNWDELTDEQKRKKRKAKLDEYNKFLVGKEHTAKSIMSTFAVSEITGKPIPGFSVEAIDDKLKTGSYIPDSNAADIQVLMGMGVDPEELGAKQDGGLGAGSGAKNREVRNNAISVSAMVEDVIFEPLYTVARINGWNPDIKFCFGKMLATTLDKNPKGIESV